MDERREVITATETTAGDVNEAHVMVPLVEGHHLNTGRRADTMVGDSKYGTIENFLVCHDTIELGADVSLVIEPMNSLKSAKQALEKTNGELKTRLEN